MEINPRVGDGRDRFGTWSAYIELFRVTDGNNCAETMLANPRLAKGYLVPNPTLLQQ